MGSDDCGAPANNALPLDRGKMYSVNTRRDGVSSRAASLTIRDRVRRIPSGLDSSSGRIAAAERPSPDGAYGVNKTWMASRINARSFATAPADGLFRNAAKIV